MTAQLLTQRVARIAGGKEGFFFSWDAFGIKGMSEEKMVSTSFDEAASHEERALTMTLPTQGHLALGLPGPCVG